MNNKIKVMEKELVGFQKELNELEKNIMEFKNTNKHKDGSYYLLKKEIESKKIAVILSKKLLYSIEAQRYSHDSFENMFFLSQISELLFDKELSHVNKRIMIELNYYNIDVKFYSKALISNNINAFKVQIMKLLDEKLFKSFEFDSFEYENSDELNANTQDLINFFSKKHISNKEVIFDIVSQSYASRFSIPNENTALVKGFQDTLGVKLKVDIAGNYLEAFKSYYTVLNYLRLIV